MFSIASMALIALRVPERSTMHDGHFPAKLGRSNQPNQALDLRHSSFSCRASISLLSFLYQVVHRLSIVRLVIQS